MVIYEITEKLMYQELAQLTHGSTGFLSESSETCSVQNFQNVTGEVLVKVWFMQ